MIKRNEVFYLYNFEGACKKVNDNLYIVEANNGGYSWLKLNEGSQFVCRKGRGDYFESDGYAIEGGYKSGFAQPIYDKDDNIVKVIVDGSKYSINF